MRTKETHHGVLTLPAASMLILLACGAAPQPVASTMQPPPPAPAPPPPPVLPDAYEIHDLIWCLPNGNSRNDRCLGWEKWEESVAKYRSTEYADGVPGFPAAGCIQAIADQFDQEIKSEMRPDEDDRQYEARLAVSKKLRERWMRVISGSVENIQHDDIWVVGNWLMLKPACSNTSEREVTEWLAQNPPVNGRYELTCKGWDRGLMSRLVNSYAAQYPESSPMRREPCVARFLHVALKKLDFDEEQAVKTKAEQERRDTEEKERRRHEAVLSRRFAPVKEQCSENWLTTSEKCESLPNLSDEERTQCRKECADAGEHGKQQAVARALEECSEATGVPVCKIAAPAGSLPAEVSKLVKQCAKDCQASRAEERGLAAKERAAAAADRRSCLVSCRTDHQSCNQSCSDMSVGKKSCLASCKSEAVKCERGC